MTTTYGRPLGPKTDARSDAHAETLTGEDLKRIERDEYELYKSHMADAQRKVQLDRMSAVQQLHGQLSEIKRRAAFDPVLREIFDQIAALKGQKFSVEAFDFVAEQRSRELMAAPLPAPIMPTRWKNYQVPQHLVAEDAAKAAAKKADAAKSLAEKAAQARAEQAALDNAARAAAAAAQDAADESDEIQSEVRK